nr:hypothetical protein [Angustibacter aerolatus]
MRQARDKAWGVVVAGLNTDLGSGLSGWMYEARRGRQGLLLSPQSIVEGETVGVRLTRSMVSPRVVPGRGLLAGTGGDPVLVQVPWVEPALVL